MSVSPEQIAAMQQTNQFGGMGDPAMQPPQQQQDPLMTAQMVILDLINWAAGRREELIDFVMLTDGISRLASAYKSLSDQGQGQGQNMEIEMEKAALDMELKQKHFEMQQAMAQLDMEIKQQGFMADQQRKQEDQILKQEIAIQQQQHAEETNLLTISNKHEIEKIKAQNGAKPKGSTGS